MCLIVCRLSRRKKKLMGEEKLFEIVREWEVYSAELRIRLNEVHNTINKQKEINNLKSLL